MNTNITNKICNIALEKGNVEINIQKIEASYPDAKKYIIILDIQTTAMNTVMIIHEPHLLKKEEYLDFYDALKNGGYGRLNFDAGHISCDGKYINFVIQKEQTKKYHILRFQ